MNQLKRIIIVIGCLALSLAGHTFLLSYIGLLGSLDFATPVRNPPTLQVVLKNPAVTESKAPRVRNTPETKNNIPAQPAHESVTIPQPKAEAAPPPQDPDSMHVPAVETATKTATPIVSDKITDTEPPLATDKNPPNPFVLDPPLRFTDEFMENSYEKLIYRISALGMPVGNAELKAINEKGEIRISLRVRSDLAFSSVYPVDDLVETRHINGNFILTRIRQKEGNFHGDRGFTIFLRDKRVFWIDRLNNRSLTESIPNSDVVDILSGLYFLRNRALKIGSTETLHIYDSTKYSAIPVKVLRRESVTLPPIRKINALLLRPQMSTGGIFRRTGDVQIWLSDDEFKVPVKIVTSIAIGQVTAELMSAKSSRSNDNSPQ